MMKVAFHRGPDSIGFVLAGVEGKRRDAAGESESNSTIGSIETSTDNTQNSLFYAFNAFKICEKKKLMNIYTGRKKKKLHEYLNLNVNIYV